MRSHRRLFFRRGCAFDIAIPAGDVTFGTPTCRQMDSVISIFGGHFGTCREHSSIFIFLRRIVWMPFMRGISVEFPTCFFTITRRVDTRWSSCCAMADCSSRSSTARSRAVKRRERWQCIPSLCARFNDDSLRALVSVMSETEPAYRGRIKYTAEKARAYQNFKPSKERAELRLVERAFKIIPRGCVLDVPRSEEHTSELQSRFGISYAV